MPLPRGVVLKNEVLERGSHSTYTPPFVWNEVVFEIFYRITATNVLYFCVDKFNRFFIDKMFSFINHAKILGGHPAHYQSTVGWSIAQNATPG